MKNYIIWGVIIIIIYIIYLSRYEIKWFIDAIKVTYKNNKGIKDIQKEGMNKRNLSNNDLKKYISVSKEILKKLKIDINRNFKLDKQLEQHLRYSRFSEKYVLELFYEILDFMQLNKEFISLKVNYISSKYYIKYVGLYQEFTDNKKKRKIILNIQNDMTMDTVISIIAHECTHYLLMSNNIKLENRIKNECLTDVTAVILGFGKYMINGYKISNRVIYDEINHRSIKKDRVGYLSFKDIEYVLHHYNWAKPLYKK